jgi:AcrR family transcriptional regulator
MGTAVRVARKKTTRLRRKPSSPLPESRIRLDVEERRTQLVELGLEHFGERAYDDVSIDAIAAAAGISKGLLYHYFPTKRAYYAATVREAAARLVESTRTPEDIPPIERLYVGLDAYLGYVRLHARAYATLMRTSVDPTILRIVDETRATFIERLTSGFAQGAGLVQGAASPTSLESPLLRLALRGWVGLSEAVALGWTEAIAAGRPAPSQSQVRTLLASSLLEIVRSAVATGA